MGNLGCCSYLGLVGRQNATGGKAMLYEHPGNALAELTGYGDLRAKIFLSSLAGVTS